MATRTIHSCDICGMDINETTDPYWSANKHLASDATSTFNENTIDSPDYVDVCINCMHKMIWDGDIYKKKSMEQQSSDSGSGATNFR